MKIRMFYIKKTNIMGFCNVYPQKLYDVTIQLNKLYYHLYNLNYLKLSKVSN